MFCPNCGQQNPNNTNYCQSCGSRLNNGTFPNSGGNLKTKEEYLRSYRSNNPQIIIFFILSILCDVIGFLIILSKLINLSSKSYLSSSDEKSLEINIVLAVFVIVIGSIFLILCKYYEKKGISEYETYYKLNYMGNSYGNSSVSNKSNQWICSKCGMLCTNNTSTCGNCGTSRQKVINNNPSANEWKCPSCGRINQNYVGTCGCGTRKP